MAIENSDDAFDRTIHQLIPDNGESAILLDLAAAAEGQQPEFVEAYKMRRALGISAVHPLVEFELVDAEAQLQALRDGS